MKIDHDYLKRLLEAFEDHPSPAFNKDEIEAAGFDVDSSEFLFHMRILNDDHFIERIDGKSGFGHAFYVSDEPYWICVGLRLTSRGHEFIASIRRSEIWEILKRDFKEESLSALWKAGKDLAEGFAKQKLKKYLE